MAFWLLYYPVNNKDMLQGIFEKYQIHWVLSIHVVIFQRSGDAHIDLFYVIDLLITDIR
jgi:hypothetical protein